MGTQRYTQQDLMNFDWDDTPLIAAYDKAKARATAKIKKQAKNKSPKIPTISEETEDKQQWHVGSYCRAVYPEDGYYYEAKVIELDDDGTCMVEFLGYDETEEVRVKKLKRSKGKKARKSQIKSVMDTSAMSLTCGEASEAESAGVASSVTKERRQKKRTVENVVPSKPLPTVSYQPYMAGPPPLPPMPQSVQYPGIANDPALSALLRSWYMAGYYYGLYEQNQRGDSCSARCCCSCCCQH